MIFYQCHPFRFFLLLFFSAFVGTLAPASALAGDSAPPLPSLEPVTVRGARTDTLTTGTTIDKELIEVLPNRNGNVTDLLELVPGVQVSEEFGNSKTGGEIRPAELSISGGRTSENNFILDGTGNNSLLDPDFSGISHIDNVPGHSQELFIPDHLINDITVLRSNIPARYGGFSGGVVIMNTKDPELVFSGELSYKMTDSDWGKFYIADEDEEVFKDSIDASNQPNFTKYQIATLLNLPMNPESGVMLSYSRAESAIPLRQVIDKKVQRRRNETLFLKYTLEPDTRNKLSFSATHAPYQGNYFLANTLNSDYTIEGGGNKLSSKWINRTGIGIATVNLAWMKSENTRHAPQNRFSWNITDSKNWAADLVKVPRSFEGGLGDIEKLQETLTANLNFDFKEITTGPAKHTFNTGFEIERAVATLDRKVTTTFYAAATTDSNTDCNGSTEDCIDGEQFFWAKNVYPAYLARAEITNYHGYFEDKLEIARLTLRPGVRISYNDYQKNTDLAPRFAASYDLFGNQKTLLIGGFNKYYESNLLTHKLIAQKPAFESWRRSLTLDADGHPGSWEKRPLSTIIATRVSDLETPYSNEFTVGIKQKLWRGDLELLYIDRDYKNQIVTVALAKDENGVAYDEFQNAGRRYHEEVSLAWTRSWKNQYLEINASWQETKSNSSSYADRFNPDTIDEQVWYNGKPVNLSELLVDNFNRPYTASLIFKTRLPHGITFTNTTKFRSRYRTVSDTRENKTLKDGRVLNIYENVSKGSSLIYDWILSWEPPHWKTNSLLFTLEIYNVFNRRIEVGTVDNEYLLGRQLWAGINYNF